jgi:hypothetical protein
LDLGADETGVLLFELAGSFLLLGEGHHCILLERFDVILVNLVVEQGDLLHGLVGLQLELVVVEIDQLVADPVHVAPEATLPRHHILVVVYVLVKEVSIL